MLRMLSSLTKLKLSCVTVAISITNREENDSEFSSGYRFSVTRTSRSATRVRSKDEIGDGRKETVRGKS